jgi:hypothetical protein
MLGHLQMLSQEWLKICTHPNTAVHGLPTLLYNEKHTRVHGFTVLYYKTVSGYVNIYFILYKNLNITNNTHSFIINL